MAAANPLWGAPRIHGELLKRGVEISERTVSRLLPRKRRPPSQTWKAFLESHVNELVSVDFFTVPTATFRVLFVLVVLGSPSAPRGSFQRHRASHGGLDRSASPGSVSRGSCTPVPDPRPRWSLWRPVPRPRARNGHDRGARAPQTGQQRDQELFQSIRAGLQFSGIHAPRVYAAGSGQSIYA
jgi:hypothetical protein